MLVVSRTDARAAGIVAAVESIGSPRIAVAPEEPFPRAIAVGCISDDDALDDPVDPHVDVDALAAKLREAGVSARDATLAAVQVAEREDVRALSGDPIDPEIVEHRPATLFELHAIEDVLGPELARLLQADRVRIQRRPVPDGALNHCAYEGGIARVRLVATNGRTLAGRTHALVHELGHALIAIARDAGLSFGAPYGRPDYGAFLDQRTFSRVCDEEALVRAIADAWLLRRPGVTWARTWPGAVDDVARTLDADDLAAFARFRLAQGLGLPYAPVVVRRVEA